MEGFRPGVVERIGLGPDGVPRAQSSPDLRADHRIRTRGAPGRRGGPRHQLHLHRGRARPHRAARRSSRPPAEPGRRLRRRRDAAGDGNPGRASTSGLAPAWARSSMPPWWTARPCSPRCSTRSGALSLWHDERGTNSMDTGAHYYNVYETSDGAFISVGAMESRFYRSFMKGLGFSEENIPPQDDQSQWESLKPTRGRDLPEPDTRRVAGHLRRHRRLCDSGAVARRGSAPPPQPSNEAPSSTSGGSWNRPPHHGSAAPLPRLLRRHRAPVCTPPKPSSVGVSPRPDRPPRR